MSFLEEVLSKTVDGNTILITLKKDSYSVDFKTRSYEKVKAVFSHRSSGDIYVRILSPFRSRENIFIDLKDLISIEIIDSGIFYTRVKTGIYKAECQGYRITITRDKARKNWKYKIEESVSCSWKLKTQNKARTLREAKGFVLRVAHWWKFKEPEQKENKTETYCQG